MVSGSRGRRRQRRASSSKKKKRTEKPFRLDSNASRRSVEWTRPDPERKRAGNRRGRVARAAMSAGRTLRSLEALPASSRTSAVRYSAGCESLGAEVSGPSATPSWRATILDPSSEGLKERAGDARVRGKEATHRGWRRSTRRRWRRRGRRRRRGSNVTVARGGTEVSGPSERPKCDRGESRMGGGISNFTRRGERRGDAQIDGSPT